MRSTYAFLCIIPVVLAQNQPIPAKGDNGQTGGIFGIAMPDMNNMGGLLGQLGQLGQLPKGSGATGSTPPKTNGSSLLESMFGGAGPEAPKGGVSTADLLHPGTGLYPAGIVEDATLVNHTIYAPKTPPPANVKMPIVVFGQGGCLAIGTMYPAFLTEIASHGYLVLANGPLKKERLQAVPENTDFGQAIQTMRSPQTKVQDLTDSIDWVMKGAGEKYGNIDTTKIAAMGQSCGGLEAYSASYHDDRVKLTVLLNSGVIDKTKKYLLKELKAPVAFLLGGPKDIAYPNGEADYGLLPVGLPSFKANLDSGHGGTYTSKNGGKFGKATVALLEWVFRSDAKSKAICLDPSSSGSLVGDHWNVTYKNWS